MRAAYNELLENKQYQIFFLVFGLCVCFQAILYSKPHSLVLCT